MNRSAHQMSIGTENFQLFALKTYSKDTPKGQKKEIIKLVHLNNCLSKELKKKKNSMFYKVFLKDFFP